MQNEQPELGLWLLILLMYGVKNYSWFARKEFFYYFFIFLCYKTYIFTFTFLKTNSTDPIKSMSKETLTSTFTELRKNFLRLAMRFLPNKEDADDALQEAFFRLWRHADQIGSREEAEALTVVTVKNLCIDTLRKRNNIPTVELDENRDESVCDQADESIEREERFRMLERIIELRLTPLQQQILRMKEYEGKKYNEIADILGMQEPAVRMQLSRARKEIRDCYLKQMER